MLRLKNKEYLGLPAPTPGDRKVFGAGTAGCEDWMKVLCTVLPTSMDTELGLRPFSFFPCSFGS